jgi:hypothetical protein
VCRPDQVLLEFTLRAHPYEARQSDRTIMTARVNSRQKARPKSMSEIGWLAALGPTATVRPKQTSLRLCQRDFRALSCVC